jgi:hypothetical protein
MNPIQYVKRMRIWLLSILVISFITGSSIVISLDPFINNLYIFAFLLTLFVFLTCLVGLLALWWFFDERRKLLTTTQINQILYQSLITSGVVVTVLVLNQTSQLSFVSITLVLGAYLLYQLWANSY